MRGVESVRNVTMVFSDAVSTAAPTATVVFQQRNSIPTNGQVETPGL